MSTSSREKLLERAQELDRDLRAVRHALQKPAEAEFVRGGLTGAQRSIMQIIVHSQGTSLKELSRQAGLAHSTVSGIVDRLEKRGMVVRQIDETDRRLSRIHPSKVVRAFLRDTLPMLTVNPLATALGRAKPAEITAIAKGIRTLRRLLEADED